MTTATLPVRTPAPALSDARIVKLLVAVNGAVPLALLVWDYFHHQLGADPAHYALLTTGLLSLIFLFLTLCVTPLRALTGWNTLLAARRGLGLYALFYACVHLGLYFTNDAGMSLQFVYLEIKKRFFLLIGIAALALMIPLALTSTGAMMRYLGAPRWKLLHRAIYFVGVLAVIHYCLHSKVVSPQQYDFVIALVLLLGYRFIARFIQLSPSAAAVSPPMNRPWKGQLKVAKITQETPDVRTFRLVHESGELPFSYKAGQYLTVTMTIDGSPVHRCYTIASAPTRPGYCEVTIKRDHKGLVSQHLHETIREGDLLSITAPSGKFIFSGAGSDSVALLAAGVGITPLMAILRHLTDRHWPGQIHLLYANRTQEDIIFHQEIAQLQASHPNLHVTLTLTCDAAAAAAAWTGDRGRIDSDLIRRTIPNPTQTPFYLCGPAEMLAATRTMLQDIGVPDTRIFQESFGTSTSPQPDSPDPVASHTITFARSGRSVQAPSNRPILEVAGELAIHVDFDCRSGICGTCKCRLSRGSVVMPTQDALTPADQKNHFILLCQALPTSDVTVDA